MTTEKTGPARVATRRATVVIAATADRRAREAFHQAAHPHSRVHHFSDDQADQPSEGGFASGAATSARGRGVAARDTRRP